MNNKSFFNYLRNRINDCETHDVEPTRVLEALYILSDYMNQADDSNIDIEDGHIENLCTTLRHNNIPDNFVSKLNQVPDDWRDMLNYLCSITPENDDIEELYDKKVTLEFNGHRAQFSFDAVICDQLITTIETMIKEY